MYNLSKIIIYPGPFGGKTNMQKSIQDLTEKGYKIITINETAMDLINDSNNQFGDENVKDCDDVNDNVEGKTSEKIIGKTLVKKIF